MITHKKTILPNGLRIITVPMPENNTVTVQVLVEAGSTSESADKNGVAHFLEHMCFKGTKNRTGLEINSELDSLGARSNAFTGNEYTGYYAKADKKHLGILIDIISDIYLNSTFDQKEADKERGVIIEELNMYEDLPRSKVWDNLEAMMFEGTSAGRSIIGTKETINSINQKDFFDFRAKHYNASSTVVVVAGGVDNKKVVKMISEAFANLPKKKAVMPPKIKFTQAKPALSLFTKKVDQCHLAIAFRAFDSYSKKKVTLGVLNGVLGMGMSSRLFRKMRDELGMCYYTGSDSYLARSYGYAEMHAGVKISRAEEAVQVMLDEVRKLKTDLVPKEELDKVKSSIRGGSIMANETSDDYAGFYGFQELARREIKNINEMVKETQKVEARDIKKLANELFVDKNLNISIVGPQEDKSPFEKLMKM